MTTPETWCDATPVPPSGPAEAAPCAPGWGLKYLDASLVVIDKPHGMLSVPGRGPDKADCAASRVQAAFADALVVHRLDMATSGLLVFGRGATAQRALGRAFEEGRVSKTYEAVVAGHLRADSGRIELPLAADWPNRPKQRTALEGGKPSITDWRVLSRDAAGGTTRLALTPLTGRTHQLRVHLQAIGHPILGDALYAPAEVQAAANRLLLHACRLALPHPTSGDVLSLDSAVPF